MATKHNTLLIAGSSALLLLSACGSDSSNVSPEAQIEIEEVQPTISQTPVTTYDLPHLAVNGLDDVVSSDVLSPWLASIRTYRRDSFTPGTGDALVQTYGYTGSPTFQDYIDFYGTNAEAIDTCEVREDDNNSSASSSSSSSSSNLPYVSAGQEVVINAANGTWFSIMQGDAGTYEVDNELPGAIPTGATLSIPGDIFPSVGAFPLMEPAAPVRISPTTNNVTVDDEYRWEAIGGRGTYMQLSFFEYDSNGDFIGYRIGCIAEDDGEFELPMDALLAIASARDSRLEVLYTRRIRQLNLLDGVAIYSHISVGE